jgi:GNAT superfamily N-acetyltransferase
MPSELTIIKTKILTHKQEEQIAALWNEEYPVKLADRFRLLLEGVENYNHYILEDEQQNVIAWAVDFEKENELRFSIIVRSDQQGKGLGSSLVEKLKIENEEFYGWVIEHNNDLKLYNANALLFETGIFNSERMQIRSRNNKCGKN